MKITLSLAVLALAASQAMAVVPKPIAGCTKEVVVLRKPEKACYTKLDFLARPFHLLTLASSLLSLLHVFYFLFDSHRHWMRRLVSPDLTLKHRHFSCMRRDTDSLLVCFFLSLCQKCHQERMHLRRSPQVCFSTFSNQQEQLLPNPSKLTNLCSLSLLQVELEVENRLR